MGISPSTDYPLNVGNLIVYNKVMHESLGKLFISMGVLLVGLGVILLFADKIPLGRLPGDIVIRGGRFTFYFPIVTMLFLSLLATLLLNLLFRR